MYEATNGGRLEVICGSMFSGKTEQLISRIKEAKNQEKNIACFKPKLDNRYDENSIVSHNGNQVKAIAIKHIEDILTYINPKSLPDIIAIDEVQFFTNDVVEIVRFLMELNIHIIVAGLDNDFRGLPFGPMPELLSLSDVVVKLTAICSICKKEATRTQRLIDGKPASMTDPLIMIGALESYEARCRKHHEVLGKQVSPYKKKLFQQ